MAIENPANLDLEQIVKDTLKSPTNLCNNFIIAETGDRIVGVMVHKTKRLYTVFTPERLQYLANCLIQLGYARDPEK